jgi:hypothetical protein
MQNEYLSQLLQNDFAQYCIAQAGNAGCENFEIGPHHRLLIQKLSDVEAGLSRRVILAMPPQHGKSTIASKLFPAWFLGRNPTGGIISASYGQEFANDFGLCVRNLVANDVHRLAFPDCAMSDDSSAQHRFFTTRGGVYYAVGRGSAITGRGGNIILIDDPIKNRVEASSQAIREKVKHWYTSDIITRQRDKNASIIVIQTRWHVDDLAGYLLRDHPHENWEVLEFPAIANAEDVLGRHPGQALWESRFPLEWLENQRRGMPTNDWLSLYQQKPTIGSGYLFRREWLRFYDPAKNPPAWESMNRAILVDPANSEKAGSDYTYFWVLGASEDHEFYVLDVRRDHFTLVERGDTLFELHKKWKRPRTVGYEQYGMQADVSYLKERMDRESYHFAIEPVGGQVSKPDRIERLEPLFREGRIWIPSEVTYRNKDDIREDLIHAFVEEEYAHYVAGGGGVKHDDGLDALSRLFDVNLQFPTPSMLGFAYKALARARNERKSRTSPWAA